MNENEVICPYCKAVGEYCDFPDLFYSDMVNSKELNDQLEYLVDIQELGYSVVTCHTCGQVFICKM